MMRANVSSDAPPLLPQPSVCGSATIRRHRVTGPLLHLRLGCEPQCDLAGAQAGRQDQPDGLGHETVVDLQQACRRARVGG